MHLEEPGGTTFHHHRRLRKAMKSLAHPLDHSINPTLLFSQRSLKSEKGMVEWLRSLSEGPDIDHQPPLQSCMAKGRKSAFRKPCVMELFLTPQLNPYCFNLIS